MQDKVGGSYALCIRHLCGYSDPELPGGNPCKGCIPDEQNRVCDKPVRTFPKDVAIHPFEVVGKDYQV